MKNLPVLIIGAGPSGLMLACLLAQYRIDFRIIEKKDAPTQGSNATWIQPRTLEILDQIGIVSRFTKAGHVCDAINFFWQGKHLSKLSLQFIRSIYPFILMLPQSKTEQLLEEYLNEMNHHIERSTELVDIKIENNSVKSILKKPDGQSEEIISDWLAACDGSNSIIREKSGLHLTGEDLPEQCMVADATIDFSYLARDEINFFFNKGDVLATFPLGENKYRIAGNLHLETPRKFFTEHEVIEMVQERARGQYYVRDVSWVSPFWIHGKIISSMQNGPVLFVGDSAHIHSPAAGQGMNTAIQDAYNLAWKLALVIQQKAQPSLLTSYQVERYPVATETVKLNEHFTKLALFDKKFNSSLSKFSKMLSEDKNGKLQCELGEKITLLNIAYEDSPIIAYSNSTSRTGIRLPDIKINDLNLYNYLNYTNHHLLFFLDQKTNAETISKINSIISNLNKEFRDLIKCHIVQDKESIPFENAILDTNQRLHHFFDIEKPSLCIIRPDTYISYFSTDIKLEDIRNYLLTILK